MSEQTHSDKKAILVIGAGDATGSAIARGLAKEGYVACMTRRSADKLAPTCASASSRPARRSISRFGKRPASLAS